jgi:hypothetical protein
VSRALRSVSPVFVLLSSGVLAGAWWLGIRHSSAISNTARWVVRSRQYKAEVLAQPDPANNELKHIERDAWGWGGEDTMVYLVFDRTDSLSQAAKSHQSGKYNGLPCEVSRVRRLESQWYTVQFYTGEWWDETHIEAGC